MPEHLCNKAGMTIDPKGEGGELVTLLAATKIETDDEVTGAWVTGLDKYQQAVIALTLSGKVMDALTTLDVYVQTSPDGGTTPDDLVHFTQVTNGAVPNGTYVAFLNPHQVAPIADRAVGAKALAAHSIQSLHWCDRMRVVLVPANFAGADEITVAVTAFMIRT
jgi:hypothetical protein